MRLFVALDLSGEVRSAVARVQTWLASRLGPDGASLRFVRPEHLHVTLVFLGEVDGAGTARAVGAMTGALGTPPFHVAFGGLGVFPRHGRPRAVFLEVSSGLARAAALQRLLADRLQQAGVHCDSRPFHPHLTVARVRAAGAANLRRQLGEAADEVAGVEVVEVTLYQSQLSSTGPAYTALARMPLGERV